ncbi:MAG TPA: M20/M25/M40 family metallo-hydrolase, partial [Micromonosporaceae bacterium]|nr:M20/M25/M40 family metallo-hydrolase [Micromonosporaceae bacterium]
MDESLLAELDHYLDAHHDRLVAALEDLIRIPAVAAVGGEPIERMAAAAAAVCTDAGLTVRTVRTSGHPVVYAHGGPDDAPFTLMAYGHYDAFPVTDQPGWRTAPFEPVRDGDRIYGRGSGDNKGQFLAHLAAFEWWQRHNGGLPIKVKVILEG